MVVAPTPTTRLRLADGRSLDLWVDETPGAGELLPLVYHSGTPSSGYGFDVFAAAARERGLRMVGWSRPGYGSSTRLPGRRVTHVVGDTAAVVAAGNAPFVTPPGDEAALAEALGRLAADPARRRTIGAENKARARAEFDETAMVERFALLYAKVLGRPRLP